MGIVARQASWNTVLTMAGMGLGFVNMVLLYPKFLSPDEFGLTRLLVSMAVVMAQVAHLGSENTVIRYFPYFRDKANGHRGLFGFMLLVSTAGAVICALLLFLFHDRFTVWVNDASGLYARFGLLVIPLLFAEVYLLVLRGFSRSVGRSIAPIFSREFIMRLLQTLLIVVYVLVDMGYLLFLVLYIATFAITTLIVLFDLWRADELHLGFSRMRVGRRMRRSMGRYGLFTLGSGLAAIAVGNIDQVMVGAMLPNGLSYVAYYAVALFMASVIMVPARALIQPVIPLMAEAWKQRDTDKLQMLYQRTASIQFAISAFILLALWTNADALFSFLDPAYAIGIPVMLILALSNVVNISTGLSAGLVSTSRSYWFDALTGVVLLVLNVVLNYLFLLWWGLVGVAWSSLVSIVVVVGWRVAFLYRKFGLWPFDGMMLRTLAVILVTAAVFFFVPHAGSPVVDLIWRSALLAAVYWPLAHVLHITPELEEQALKLLRGIMGR